MIAGVPRNAELSGAQGPSLDDALIFDSVLAALITPIAAEGDRRAVGGRVRRPSPTPHLSAGQVVTQSHDQGESPRAGTRHAVRKEVRMSANEQSTRLGIERGTAKQVLVRPLRPRGLGPGTRRGSGPFGRTQHANRRACGGGCRYTAGGERTSRVSRGRLRCTRRPL